MSIRFRREGQWETSSYYQLVRFFVLTVPEQVRSLVPYRFYSDPAQVIRRRRLR